MRFPTSSALSKIAADDVLIFSPIVAVLAVMAMGVAIFSIRRWHYFHSNTKFGRSCDRRKPVNKFFCVKEAHARHRRTPFRSETNAAILPVFLLLSIYWYSLNFEDYHQWSARRE